MWEGLLEVRGHQFAEPSLGPPVVPVSALMSLAEEVRITGNNSVQWCVKGEMLHGFKVG